MRKLILSAFFVAASTTLFAQSFDEIKKKINEKKFDDAKEKLDKVAADPKAQGNSEYWYYKAQVYNNLGQAKGDTALLAGSLDAIRRYYDMESKVKEESKRGILAMFESNQTAFNIYNSYFQGGVKGFQASNWPVAYYNFTRTLDAFEVLSKNKLTTATFDTTSTLYAGYSAQSAKMTDEAAKYYAILANKRIADTSYVGIYEYLVAYYQSKNDAANTAKYLELGKSVFPGRPIWMQYELQDLDKDKTKKLARLAELTQQNKTDVDLWQQYALELFNYTYASDKPADYAKSQENLTNTIQTLININPASPFSNFIMSQHVSNQIYDLQQSYAAIKGTKPEDIKKKQQLNKDIDAKYELLFNYSLKAADAYSKLPEPKAVDKANYRKMLNEVAEYYRNKKQADKAKEYSDKAKAI
ncbi:MAG: hypothetical protein JWP88_666 [Flaviaesturariibacter sp.]|nr:hypothetical protein [Flaviaesturariibacter sp.]